MNFKKVTQYFILLLIVVIAVYDVVAYIWGGQIATISSVIIRDWSGEYPAFTFAMGFVMGHLFWPLKGGK